MRDRPIWRRPRIYVAAGGLLLGLAAVLAGPVLLKMDFRRLFSRAGWQLPDRVVGSLRIQPGDRVADIGAGDGYFTFRLAEAVGPSGQVFAVEVTDELIGRLEQQAQAREASNVVVVKGDFDDPLLPDGEMDLVFLCNSYHHIDNRVAYFDRLRTDLASGGRVAILDLRPMPLVSLLAPTGHWTTTEQMRDEMGRAHFEEDDSFDFLPAQGFSIFSQRSQ